MDPWTSKLKNCTVSSKERFSLCLDVHVFFSTLGMGAQHFSNILGESFLSAKINLSSPPAYLHSTNLFKCCWKPLSSVRSGWNCSLNSEFIVGSDYIHSYVSCWKPRIHLLCCRARAEAHEWLRLGQHAEDILPSSPPVFQQITLK